MRMCMACPMRPQQVPQQILQPIRPLPWKSREVHLAQSLFAQGVTTTITGATFSGDGTKKIFAGARLSTSAWSLTDTNMTLDLGSGTVAAMIAGGSWVETGESTFNITGSTNLTFKSGTYTGQIWGGSYINGTATAALTGNIGSTNITITGGTFDGAQISLARMWNATTPVPH